ncbi:MAG: transposase, partial [Megasphaera elsdenii]|nr:transposase [Megasphaera elsdenii]
MKEQLTANEIRYRTYFPELTENNFNPMNDVLFKFIFGRPERKLITIDFLNAIAAEDLGHPITDIV